jgi:hypothetical protein
MIFQGLVHFLKFMRISGKVQLVLRQQGQLFSARSAGNQRIGAQLHGQTLQVVDTEPKRDGLLRLFQKLHCGCRTPDVGHPLLEDRVTVTIGGLEGDVLAGTLSSGL